MAGGILYEVNTRVWLRELSERLGRTITLSEVPDEEIERWKSLGFTHIWLMGVWQVGPKAREVALQAWREHWSREGTAGEEAVQGSPFAIQEYAVDARLGDPLALLLLKERLNQAGLRLILDFVPNHLGLDSPEPVRYPARFVQSDQPAPGTFECKARFGTRSFAHGRDPYFDPWIDTVQLDYRVIETQKAMTAVAQTVAAYGDGMRCDMAMLLLPDIFEATWKDFPCQGAHQTMSNFWRKAIPAIRQLQPHAELIAEVYWDREEELQEAGFDYTYNKRVYDCLVRREHPELIRLLQGWSSAYLRKSVHFLENHDEPRVASKLPLRRHQLAAALILFLPGLAMLHDGQLEGRQAFARIQLNQREAEPPDPEITRFYQGLLRDLQNSVVRKGRGTVLKTDAAETVVVQWEGNGCDLALVNLGEAETELFLPAAEVPRSGEPRLLYSIGGRAEFGAVEGGLRLRLPEQSAQILRVREPE